MCGIIGYIGEKQAAPILLDSLKRLEYRGYDSVGIAVFNEKIVCYKTEGELEKLVKKVPPDLNGTVGIGHTRWATHGRPSTANAHPHLDCSGKIAVVHNGIIENYYELKEELIKKGHKFNSETDTEVLAHLIEENYNGSLIQALRNSISRVSGSFAVAVLCSLEPEVILAARKDNPLILGLGENENFIASDIPAILKYTRKMIFLDNEEMAVVKKQEVKITTFQGMEVEKEVQYITWDIKAAEKAGYEHFMLKEIYEQPKAAVETIAGRISEYEGKIVLEEMGLSERTISALEHIIIVGCGTSYNAACLGKYLLSKFARIPVGVEVASEFRYSDPAIAERTLVIGISQSGETADTLAAIREAKARGCKTLAITNVVGSSITREADGLLYIRAGPEIGVAATKTFTAQIIALYLLAIHFGLVRYCLTSAEAKRLIASLKQIPREIKKVLDNAGEIAEIAALFEHAKACFFIGRNLNYPIALEGALKMKEISYIPSDSYAAGELKHGPLALLSKDVPVVAIATKNATYEKMLSNIREVKARDAPVIAIANIGDMDIEKFVDRVIRVPEVSEELSPILSAVVVQLLAYFTARKKGCSIDKPRHLAKSVTVE
ncbi:MAG: glutamine--fructose-6-phosphate transaminase (isomerizing) [Methanocellales archaeon]